MKTEIELLREIAKESQSLWNKNLLPINAITLKNLLADFIDLKDRKIDAVLTSAIHSDGGDRGIIIPDGKMSDKPENSTCT